MNRLSLLALTGLLVLTACDSNGDSDDFTPLNVQTAANVEADPTEGRDPNTGRPISNNLFTLFDLDSGEIVLSSSQTDRAIRQRDSSSTRWDIGFKGSTIIFNGGTSGPGEGAAQLVTQTFADVLMAPESGYVADGSNTGCPSVQTPGGTFPGSPYAVCTGSDNGWYNYNGTVLTPLAGRTIALKTGDGDYAKVRILSYYRDMPTAPTQESPSRYFTFEYVVQPDGSRNLTDTTVR